jgi:hypothetical protein
MNTLHILENDIIFVKMPGGLLLSLVFFLNMLLNNNTLGNSQDFSSPSLQYRHSQNWESRETQTHLTEDRTVVISVRDSAPVR